MCGIAGELSFSDAPSSADWRHISELMRRRGPDGQGAWASSDGRCTLVFRRLAIIDLSAAGDQPMVSDCGRYALVFNGEIYNFRELRAELERRGTRFKSTSDSEVVLQALIAWGPEAFARFNGIFAIAFYDSATRRLLLARDHAGIKPLYVLRSRPGIVFASQYDQLLAHPWSDGLRPSKDALGLYLRFAFIPAPYGVLENTHMIEPGAWLESDADGRRSARRITSCCRAWGHLRFAVKPPWMPSTLRSVRRCGGSSSATFPSPRFCLAASTRRWWCRRCVRQAPNAFGHSRSVPAILAAMRQRTPAPMLGAQCRAHHRTRDRGSGRGSGKRCDRRLWRTVWRLLGDPHLTRFPTCRARVQGRAVG